MFKDRKAMLSQFIFVLKIEINSTFTLMFNERFPFSLSTTLDTLVIFYRMCRPSQTSYLDSLFT